MRDFTLVKYEKLIRGFLEANYQVETFRNYLCRGEEKRSVLILRHDVDRRPKNALVMAQIEYEIGVNASYYF